MVIELKIIADFTKRIPGLKSLGTKCMVGSTGLGLLIPSLCRKGDREGF